MGTTTKQAVAVEGELWRLPVSRIRVVDGFNPRRDRDPKQFAELVATVCVDGVLEPVVVTPNQDGDYDLVAGEERFLAAIEAGCTDVPATIRSVDPNTGGLELAMIENLVREELSPVDEAYGYQRLVDAGLTRKGVAEKVRKPLARIPRAAVHPRAAGRAARRGRRRHSAAERAQGAGGAGQDPPAVAADRCRAGRAPGACLGRAAAVVRRRRRSGRLGVPPVRRRPRRAARRRLRGRLPLPGRAVRARRAGQQGPRRALPGPRGRDRPGGHPLRPRGRRGGHPPGRRPSEP